MWGRGWLLAVAWGLGWPALAHAQTLAQTPPTCPGDVAQAAAGRDEISYASGEATVRALLYRPQQPNGRAIVVLHGARGLATDAPAFDPHAIQLASRGYYVLVPNYYDARRGTSERSSRDLQVWIRAAAEGVGFLARQPGVDAGHIAVMGYSLGGFLAGETAMAAETVEAGISVAGGLRVGEPGRARREGVPILLLHSRRDEVIPPSSTRDWGNGLTRRGAVVELQELDSRSHGLDHAHWCDAFARARTFLEASE